MYVTMYIYIYMKSYEFIYVYLDFFLYYIANIDATSRSTIQGTKQKHPKHRGIHIMDSALSLPSMVCHGVCTVCQLKG